MIGIERQKIGKKGRLWHKLRYGSMRGNEREATIGTAHTVTVNSLIESNKQTNILLRIPTALIRRTRWISSQLVNNLLT
jgi:hypothetical protein